MIDAQGRRFVRCPRCQAFHLAQYPCNECAEQAAAEAGVAGANHDNGGFLR